MLTNGELSVSMNPFQTDVAMDCERASFKRQRGDSHRIDRRGVMGNS